MIRAEFPDTSNGVLIDESNGVIVCVCMSDMHGYIHTCT